MIRSVSGYLAIAMTTMAATALADSASSGSVKVEEIDAQIEGNVYIKFDQAVSSTCGTKLRANGANNGHVLKVALAAQLAGKFVIVNFEDAKTGNYCNLNYIRILN